MSNLLCHCGEGFSGVFRYVGESFLCMYMECHYITFVVVGSCLEVSTSGGSSLKDTSWEISARGLTSNVAVRLLTIRMIFISDYMIPRV